MFASPVGRARHRGETGIVFHEHGDFFTVQTSKGRFYMHRDRVQWRPAERKG